MLAVTGCNQVNDLQPMEPQAVPSKVIRQVKDQFPLAENLVFKSLLEKQVWEVKFDANTGKYTSLVDSTKMWETFRANPDHLPAPMTSLLANSSFKGGTFSNNMEDVSFLTTPNQRNKVIYNMLGEDYVFDWLFVEQRTAGAILQKGLYLISAANPKLLPAKIQTFIAADPTLSFKYAEIRVLLNYDKIYQVQVNYDRGDRKVVVDLFFDNNGDLKWFSDGFNEPAGGYVPRNFDKVPEPIQQYLDALPELTDFITQPIAARQWKGEYKGISCYTFKFKHITKGEECEFRFDADGKLIYKMYYFYV